jgi:hypothetical protein
VALAININTAYGQTLKNTELYIYGSVSTISPLYGAFPRAIKLHNIKIKSTQNKDDTKGNGRIVTLTLVYPEEL